MITMFNSVCLLIFLWISSNYSYRLQCPDVSQRPLRASGYCTASLRSKYTCLFDTNQISFSEQCNINPDFVTPGEKYVITGNIRNVDCSSDRYQPFRLWSNVSGECLYTKSLCDGEGQVVFNNGSRIEDRRCRCDYTKGYKFIKRPKMNCSCKPSEEDCFCYISLCPKGSVLSPDYECVKKKHYVNSNCPPIESESESLQTPEITRNTVIVFLCFDQISKIGCKQDAGCSVVVIDTKQAAAVTEEELEGHRPASVILNAVKSTASYREVNQQVINVGGNKYTADVKPTTKQILGEYTEQPTAQETVKYTTGTQINLTYPNKPVADNRCWHGSDDNGNDDKDDDSSLREDNSRSKETINDFKFEFTQKKDKILKQPIEISEVGGMNARLNERSTRDHDDQDVKAEDHYNTKLHIEQENKEQDTKIEPLDKILVNNKREKERQHHTINSHETISNKIMSLQSEVKAQNERFAKLDKTKSKLERENKEKDNKIEELETLLTNNISKTEKLKNTIKECNKLSKQNERVQSKMKTQNEIAEFQLRQIIKEKDTKIDTLEQLTANNKNEIQKQTIQIEDHKKLLEQNMTIQSERKSQNDRLENLEKHQSQLEHEINEKDTKIAELDTLLANHKSRIEKKEDEIKCNNIITNKNKNQIANLEKNIHQLQNENKKKYDQMQKSKDDQVKITKQIESLNKEVADKRNKVTELEQKSKLKGDEIKHLKELYRTQERETGDEIQKLKALYRTQEKETGDEIHKLKELLGTQEKKIRKLRNTIQDLKGNVRVFCRVRPLLTNESERNDGIGKHWIFPDQKENTLSLDKTKIAACPRKTKRSSHEPMEYNFSFDKVFTGSSTQDDVFKEISQLVHSAIDGYHVCIFAYGQTGSGKTYTMEGPYFENGNNKGMIPRAVQKIFCTTRKLESAGWQ
ncbi:uncharacterized protein [Mytilus edulis]|uniref:uncharacterized protein isoform X2 n=2 Tax=Mytilus edulis TaxID=6550 RepID=UPI0039EFD27F